VQHSTAGALCWTPLRYAHAVPHAVPPPLPTCSAPCCCSHADWQMGRPAEHSAAQCAHCTSNTPRAHEPACHCPLLAHCPAHTAHDHLLISSSKASLSFLPNPEPLLPLLPPLALLLPLLIPLSASATRLLLDTVPGKHPPDTMPSGSERLLLLLLRLCALLPALRDRLRDRMLLPMSELIRPLLSARSLLLALPAVLGLYAAGVLLLLSPGAFPPKLLLLLLAPLNERPLLSPRPVVLTPCPCDPAPCCCCVSPAASAAAAPPNELLLLLADDSRDGSASCCACCWRSDDRRGVVGGCCESSEAASPAASCCCRKGRGGRVGCTRSDGLLVLRRAAETDAQCTAAS
jgi:hypothetical protein